MKFSAILAAGLLSFPFVSMSSAQSVNDAQIASIVVTANQVDIEKMIVVGLPFVEILKIARDLDLPMIVMGIRGQSTPADEILFGSTAEKVLRGTRVPVLCVPL